VLVSPPKNTKKKGFGKNFLSFQWEVIGKLTFSEFQGEINKADVRDTRINHSFVILAPKQISKWMKKGNTLVDKMGYYFDSKSEVKGKVNNATTELAIPKNMKVYLLTEEGIKNLILASNYDIFF